MNKTAEQGISDIMGCLTDPIIVFPGGWGDTLPEWLKTSITLERMIESMQSLKGEEIIGTDAEVCAYLMTVSLTQPIDSDWTRIYLYVAGKTCKRWNKSEIPPDINVEKISDHQMRELTRLKKWIYRQRVNYRTEKERDQRRQIKQEMEEQKKLEQPALFGF